MSKHAMLNHMSGRTEQDPPEGQASFAIHSLNNYTNSFVSSMIATFDLDSTGVRDVLEELYRQTVTQLTAAGVNYADLRWALTPRTTHFEIAYLFDSTRVESSSYGREIAESWLPALWSHGPKRTAISHGDLVHAPSWWVWKELSLYLTQTREFARLSTEQYYVVYFTNLSASQVGKMDTALRKLTPTYLGYIDCSTWIPLKSCMLLPQYAIRNEDALIVPLDDSGSPHFTPPGIAGRFRLVGVTEELYGVVLDHRMDNGVPEWADRDSTIALTMLGGKQLSMQRLRIELDERRFDYLVSESKGHGASVRRAGLGSLSRRELVQAVESKIRNSLIYNLRFVDGTRAGEPAPENDAWMFSVQVELPDESKRVRRYQVGIKYKPRSHVGELVTFY